MTTTIYSNGELFLAGMVTGVLLCLALALAMWIKPKVESGAETRRRRSGERAAWQRMVDEAYDAGRSRGREDLLPKPVMRIERVGVKGWRGTTRAAVLTADDGRGAA